MSAEDWQRTLRRQFGREQRFALRNIGDEPVFSDFDVGNDATGARYRVSIRGPAPGDNQCTCMDFASNDLGTASISSSHGRGSWHGGAARRRWRDPSRRRTARCCCTLQVSAR